MAEPRRETHKKHNPANARVWIFGVRTDNIPADSPLLLLARAGARARHCSPPLVELHGGRVEWCSDGEGCGSTFTVSLPLTAATKNGNQSSGLVTDGGSRSSVFTPVTSLENVQILIVEDDKDTRHMLQ